MTEIHGSAQRKSRAADISRTLMAKCVGMVCLSAGLLAACSSPPTPRSWSELEAIGPILTLADINSRRNELDGQMVVIDGFLLSNGRGDHFDIIGGSQNLVVDSVTGAKGVACDIPSDGHALWTRNEEIPEYAKQFFVRRVVLLARFHNQLAPTYFGIEVIPKNSGINALGPLTEVQVLRVFDEHCY